MDNNTLASAIADLTKKIDNIAAALARIEGGISPIPPDAFIRFESVLKIFGGVSKNTWLAWERDGIVPPRLVLPHGKTGYLGSTLREMRESLPTVFDSPDAYLKRQAAADKIVAAAQRRAQEARAEISTTN